jgi:hypothetical protein
METAGSIMSRGLTSSSCQPADFATNLLRAGFGCSAPQALHDLPVCKADGSAGMTVPARSFYKNSRPCREIITISGVRTRLPNEGGRLMVAIGDGARVDERVTGRLFRLGWS